MAEAKSTPCTATDARTTRSKAASAPPNSGEREAEVQAKGREMVMERGVEHLIHNLDGTIGERNTYPAAATLSGIPGRRPSRRR